MESLKIIFLDRDGTIIKDKGYMYKPTDLEFINKAIDGLVLLQNMGFTLIIVSNQSGVGRKYFTKSMFKEFEQHFKNYLDKNLVKIQFHLYCFHKPDDNCGCRKPRIGMIKNIVDNNKISKEYSFVIGDKYSDIQFGENLGINKILLNNSKKTITKNTTKYFIASDLYNAALLIKNNYAI